MGEKRCKKINNCIEMLIESLSGSFPRLYAAGVTQSRYPIHLRGFVMLGYFGIFLLQPNHQDTFFEDELPGIPDGMR
jgi:hypothetical protein